MIEPGTKLGRYEIRSKIGEGGMGEVYLARDTTLDRNVAIKMLPAETSGDSNAAKRLIREAKAAATLDHPNICAVYEVGEERGRTFIVMQYVEGETLDALIRRKPIPLTECLALVARIADALAEAHAHGIIHRDIKPSNIIVTARGQVKVMDFGLAKFSAPSLADGLKIDGEAATQAWLTTPGTIIGTVPYMSPEQLRGEALDARTDIFSLGLVLYEMIAGRHPFSRETGAATASATLTEEPQPLARFSTTAPSEIERIVRKCLAKDRERRYQTARDLHTDLESVAGEIKSNESTAKTLMQPPRAITERRRSAWHARLAAHRTRLLIMFVGALLMIAVVLYALQRRRTATGTAGAPIKSIAVLPLKSLDAGENYLGLGIADAVIRRLSQTGELTVRPLSAVRRYLNEDTDALTAARQLSADAVLEGTVQRANDRLRVSINLLRTSDGASIWADSFDMRSSDIFTIEDTMSQQVASRLRLRLDAAQQARLTMRTTSNQIAYDFYVKGLYNFDQQRGRAGGDRTQAEATIELFKKAIEADPNYALAHAQLANTYVDTGLFVEPNEPSWLERAKEEIERAQSLDSQLAETHVARSFLLWGAHEGWRLEDAMREMRTAEQCDPNVGHQGLGVLYQHAGLEELSARERQRALEIDPTNDSIKRLNVEMPAIVRNYDESFAAAQKLFGETNPGAEYFLSKGRLDDAQKAIEDLAARDSDNFFLPQARAVLFALKGDFRSAEAQVPLVLSKVSVNTPPYHHATYDIACVYALENKPSEAVKWLRETARTGFPCYPLFERDPYLNRIRQAPEFVQFLTDMKTQHEQFKRQFSDAATQ